MADDSGHDGGAEITLDQATTIAPTRRRALWGVLAVVALVTGGVVVASSNDEGSPRLPVALGSAASREADSAMAGASMAAWVTYVAGDDLPALGGSAAAYRLTSAVDADSVRALATALGMTGAPVHKGESWLLESDDAVLQVDENSGSWWYSINGGGVAYAEDVASSGGSVSTETILPADQCAADGQDCDMRAPDECPPDATCDSGGSTGSGGTEPAEPGEPPTTVVLPEPGPPTPPADLPSETEARRMAIDLITATGGDVADANVTVDGPHDAWYVTIEHRVDGTPASGWISTVGVGSKSAVMNASRWLAEVERVGDYPMIDTRAAIDRLNDLQGGFDSGPIPLDGDVPMDDQLHDPVASTVVEGGSCKVQPDGREICEYVAEGEPVPPECPPDADCAGWEPYPGPPETYEQPAPVEVVLTDAEPVLTMMPSTDGSNDLYLVPGYRFSGEEGALVEVAAIEDDSLAPIAGKDDPIQGEPGQTEPAPQPVEPDAITLEPGEEPEIGVGYYVDVNIHCGWVVFADRWWATDESTPLRWSDPTEGGGTFTLSSPDEATLVGDFPGAEKVAFAARGPAAEMPGCA